MPIPMPTASSPTQRELTPACECRDHAAAGSVKSRGEPERIVAGHGDPDPGEPPALGLLAGLALFGAAAGAETLGKVLAGRAAHAGPGLPERALDPAVLRAIFRPDVN